MPTELFMPQPERRKLLRRYGKEYGLDTFIETGTNQGETCWFLKDDFQTLYTIELSGSLYREAVKRFQSYPNVVCVQGDSSRKLAQVLRKVKEPALIWLDGHYSGPGTARGPENTPVLAELAAIFATGVPHVILVDDARCFYGGGENPIGGTPRYDHYGTYPPLAQLEELAEANGYTYELKDDVIRLIPIP